MDASAEHSLLRRCASLLVPWYRQVRRELPWRDRPTPYQVWISEIMLQQTRIEAVIPYYARFLAELPDVAALAAVPEDRLLKLWEGLGYYSRARNLKKAALQIMELLAYDLFLLVRQFAFFLREAGGFCYGGIISCQGGEGRKLGSAIDQRHLWVIL